MNMRVGLLKGAIVLVLFGLLFVSSTAFAQPLGNHYAKVVLLNPKTHSYGLKQAWLFNTSLPIAPVVKIHKKSFQIVIGTVGVYNGVVYLNLSIPFHVIKIGNQTFVVKNETFVPLFVSHEHVLKNSSYLGIIEDKNITSYVLNKTGSYVTIFPPSGNSTFKFVVKDVGALNSQPQSVREMIYVPIPSHNVIIMPMSFVRAFEKSNKHFGR
jgi:hypothetical protein